MGITCIGIVNHLYGSGLRGLQSEAFSNKHFSFIDGWIWLSQRTEHGSGISFPSYMIVS
jgi:hypothetical protein